MLRDGGRPLNAFEIINAALDISALFERRSDVVKRHTRFTSRESPERIAEAMEAAHAQLGGTSERNSFKCVRPWLCHLRHLNLDAAEISGRWQSLTSVRLLPDTRSASLLP